MSSSQKPLRLLGVLLAALFVTVAVLWSTGRPGVTPRVLTNTEAERYLLAGAREGETELVVGLIRAGAPVETRDARGFTPLILASYHGHAETVSALLQAGASACTADGRGNTALMGAAFKGHANVIRVLLTQPCAVDQANGVGQTALMFARLFGRSEVADLLQSAGASAQKRDMSGRTSEDWASTQSAPSPVAPLHP